MAANKDGCGRALDRMEELPHRIEVAVESNGLVDRSCACLMRPVLAIEAILYLCVSA